MKVIVYLFSYSKYSTNIIAIATTVLNKEFFSVQTQGTCKV